MTEFVSKKSETSLSNQSVARDLLDLRVSLGFKMIFIPINQRFLRSRRRMLPESKCKCEPGFEGDYCQFNLTDTLLSASTSKGTVFSLTFTGKKISYNLFSD